LAIIFSYQLNSSIFTRENSYCFQCVLAIAILSVRPSVRHRDELVKSGAS